MSISDKFYTAGYISDSNNDSLFTKTCNQSMSVAVGQWGQRQ